MTVGELCLLQRNKNGRIVVQGLTCLLLANSLL